MQRSSRPLRGAALLSLCCVLLVACQAASPAASSSGAWLMYRGDLQRDGRASSSFGVAAARHLHLAWQLDLGGPVDGSPAVAGGLVLAGSEAGQLTAVDLRSGRLAWRVTGLGAITDSPAVAGGLVLVGTLEGRVVALDTGSGHQAWTWHAPGDQPAIWSSPAVWHGQVLVATASQYGDSPLTAGRLAALDLNTGRQLWIECLRAGCAPGDGVWSTPAIDSAGRAFVGVGNPDDGVVAFEASTGRILWRHSFYADLGRDLDVGATPVLTGQGPVESVDVGSTAGIFESLNALGGTQVWSRTLDAGTAVHGLIGSPAFDGSALYVPSASPPYGLISLTALGARRWSVTTSQPVYSSPALGAGLVVVGTGAVFGDRSAGELLAIRTSDGSIVWRSDAGSAVNSSPAIAGDMVLVGDYAGKLLAFAAR
ncbi:MAG TPA: PQQ-binding-like beta-propeller repeat protein [Candidatus Dormibacteraeota bacterium]